MTRPAGEPEWMPQYEDLLAHLADYEELIAAARVVVERRGESITGDSGADYYEIDADLIDALAARLPDAAAGGEEAGR